VALEPCNGTIAYGTCRLPKGHRGDHSWRPLDKSHEEFLEKLAVAKRHALVVGDFFQERGLLTAILEPLVDGPFLDLGTIANVDLFVSAPTDSTAVRIMVDEQGKLTVFGRRSLNTDVRELARSAVDALRTAGLGAWVNLGDWVE
jgi:hypothetical protein